MGKKVRLRKLAETEAEAAERAEIERRRRQRLEPTIHMIKKFTVTLLMTFVILYIGLIVNGRLSVLVERLERGI